MITSRESLILIISLLLAPCSAYAGCPKGTYRAMGICLPEVGGSVGQATEHAKNELKAQTLGPILETWIVQSERTSSVGAQPIPPGIRQALAGYIDDAAMDRARFKVGDRGVLNLAGLTVKYGDFFGGDVAAVTLNDVIVFGNEYDAYNNPALWAHELTHVGQFKDRGARGFSIAYMRQPWDMEGPAYQKGDNFGAWYRSRQMAGGAPQEPSNGDEVNGNGQHFWIAFAWNHHGDFAHGAGSNWVQAQSQALQFCAANTKGCFYGPVVPGDQAMCYAIVRDGFDLYSAIMPKNVTETISSAMAACRTSGDPGPGCAVAQSGCNDSP